jgi:phosphoglycolate phosphatase-like HAD superfamily hydrolase
VRPQKLLLWDIDGTLMLGDHAGERALVTSLRHVFGITGSLAQVEVAGRTDKLIAEDLLRAHGLEPTPQAIHDFLEGYLAALPEELGRGQPRLLPGIVRILEAVAARRDLAQGLLTGNLVRGARVKLAHFDVWRYFPFGAFADDAVQRNELGPHALRRAHAHHAVEFPPERTFVIGDTPHDIACGKVIGAVTIGVATGRFSAGELSACQPTLTLPDLDDVAGFMAFIDAHPPINVIH